MLDAGVLCWVIGRGLATRSFPSGRDVALAVDIYTSERGRFRRGMHSLGQFRGDWALWDLLRQRLLVHVFLKGLVGLRARGGARLVIHMQRVHPRPRPVVLPWLLGLGEGEACLDN